MRDNTKIYNIIKEWIRQKKNVLVLTSCSSKKINKSNIPAYMLYQGQLFQQVRRYAKRNNFDLCILSSKYGLIPNDQIISYYDEYITDKKNKIEFEQQIQEKIQELQKKYDKFLVIMGEKYRQYLKQYFDSRFLIIEDNRGIGGYKQKMCYLLNHTSQTDLLGFV